MRRLSLILLVMAAACSKKSTDEPPAPSQPSESSAEPERGLPAESEGGPTADSDAAAAEPEAGACTSDLDCETCLTKDCHCALAGSPSCGPGRCMADPCRARSASCWQGRCFVRPAAAGPCDDDGDCEIREDDCQCDVFAALRSAPADDSCAGQTCGTRPAPSQFRARCDRDARRCVLTRAGASP